MEWTSEISTDFANFVTNQLRFYTVISVYDGCPLYLIELYFSHRVPPIGQASQPVTQVRARL